MVVSCYERDGVNHGYHSQQNVSPLKISTVARASGTAACLILQVRETLEVLLCTDQPPDLAYVHMYVAVRTRSAFCQECPLCKAATRRDQESVNGPSNKISTF